MAFGSFVGMTLRALGWAFLQINKTSVNGRLQKWPKACDIVCSVPAHQREGQGGLGPAVIR